jgi:hypothetical protein
VFSSGLRVSIGGGQDQEAKDAMHRELVCQPTVMLQDNALLVKAILPRVTNKGRQLKECAGTSTT